MLCQKGREEDLMTPFEISQQLKVQELGVETKSLRNSVGEWDFSLEDVTIPEEVKWLHCKQQLEMPGDVMLQWQKEGKPKTKVDDECNFCDETTLHTVLTAKNIFEELDPNELYRARARANPFEAIHSVFFMNRAALKMANIDAATDFMFTNIDRDVFHKNHSGPYYFADVCAGPGGFTEYVLWRKKWMFKGFGFTLRDDHDFRIADSICASPVSFLPLYGARGDGNVCCPENIDDFKEKVIHETGKGVHFMMSDGGFSVEGTEDMQEILSKNIYICQCLVALEILRKHGHFVTKFFDIFTSFSVGLLYLLFHCFEKMCILKPNSSRPANSERYIVCCNFRGGDEVSDIKKYLRTLADKLWKLKNYSEVDVIEIVPLAVIKSDHNFYSYIYNSNNSIARRQTIYLQKLAAFCRNPTLSDYRQEHIRAKCLEYWQIPDKPHIPLPRFSVADLLLETVDNRGVLCAQPREFKEHDLENVVSNSQKWQFILMFCSRKTNVCTFYAGVEMSRVYRFKYNKWIRVKNLRLIRGTLLYGELVKERSVAKDSDALNHKYSLHVIDALRLGDINMADLPFKERLNLIQTYCSAVNHEFRKNSVRIRPKFANKLETLPGYITVRKDEETVTYISALLILGYKAKEEFYEVNSVLLVKTDESQSSDSTYIIRKGEADEDKEKYVSIETLINTLSEKSSV